MKLCVVLLLALGCSSSPAPSPKPPAEAPPVAGRFQIGALEAYALEDGHLEIPNDAKMLGAGREPTETGDVLAAAGLPRDTIRLDIQCLLVKAGDRVLLFDTGLAGAYPNTGKLPASLAAIGVAPAAITDIFISHAHGDHVFGLVTKDGGLAFPAAAIHISAPEWKWAQAYAEKDETARRVVTAITPKVATFEPGAQLLPAVKAVATQGHTPGHSSYEIGSGTDKVFYLGDVAHHYVISVQRPAWAFGIDDDRAAAEAVRQQTLARLAAEHTRVFAPHFPYPGVGRIVAEGGGLAWKP